MGVPALCEPESPLPPPLSVLRGKGLEAYNTGNPLIHPTDPQPGKEEDEGSMTVNSTNLALFLKISTTVSLKDLTLSFRTGAT